MHNESAVVSMTSRRRSMASRWVSSGRNFASGFWRGSPSYTPSTEFFAMRIASAPISSARSAAADVRLRDLRHGDRRLDPRVHAGALERVLERERVQEGRQHSRVVGRRPIHPLGGRRHAAIDVPGPDDDRELGSGLVDGVYLAGDRLDGPGIDPVFPPAEKRLPGELEQDPVETRRSPGRNGPGRFLSLGAHEPATEIRAKRTTEASASSSACATDLPASWIHAWSASTPP